MNSDIMEMFLPTALAKDTNLDIYKSMDDTTMVKFASRLTFN